MTTKKESVALDHYLGHESRICRLEAVIENIDSNMTDLKNDVREIRNDVHSLRGEYKSYFWKAFGAMGTALAVVITVIQFVVPYIHAPK